MTLAMDTKLILLTVMSLLSRESIVLCLVLQNQEQNPKPLRRKSETCSYYTSGKNILVDLIYYNFAIGQFIYKKLFSIKCVKLFAMTIKKY